MIISRVTKRPRWATERRENILVVQPVAARPLSKRATTRWATNSFFAKFAGRNGCLKLEDRQLTQSARRWVLRAVEVERLSLRAAERVFGAARQTAKWLEKKPRPSRR